MFDFSKITNYLSIYSGLIPLLFYVGVKYKTLSSILKVLFLYLIISISVELICIYYLSRTSNLFLQNIYTFVEGFLIIVIYQKIFENKNVIFYLLNTFFVCCFIMACFYFGKLNEISMYLITTEAFIVILLSTTYFFRLINNTQVPELTRFYLFWLNTAFLIYFSGAFFIFLTTNFILNPENDRKVHDLWILHNFFNIAYNVLLAKSVYTWKKMKQ